MAKGAGAFLLLWSAVLLVVALHSVAGHQHQHQHQHNAYQHQRATRRIRVRTACQGHHVKLSCHHGYRIQVLAAFYGRASRRICPSVLRLHRHRHHDSRHSKRCAARGSAGRVRKLCQGRRRCRVRAHRSVFGKACHRGREYLRVRYGCAFAGCKSVTRLQGKLVRLIERYRTLAKTKYGYWRRRHFRRRLHRLERKLNHIRRKYRFCFKCHRGCAHLRKRSDRLSKAETRIQALVNDLHAKRKTHHHRMRWHAGRWFLKRKLAYLRARQRMLRHRLRRCMRVCHY